MSVPFTHVKNRIITSPESDDRRPTRGEVVGSGPFCELGCSCQGVCGD